MKYRNIIFMGSVLLLVIGIAMLTAIPIGIYYADSPDVIKAMSLSAGVCLVVSIVGVLLSLFRIESASTHSALREGFASVLFAWIAAVICGSLPFVLCCRFTIADAIFETASGFSTTGASIVGPGMLLHNGEALANGIESLPMSILYWRSLLNWLGGIGFVMFALMLLPSLSGRKQLFHAEVPGLKSANDQMTARVKNTAWLLMSFYAMLTTIMAVSYYFLGMHSWFEAVCHAFSTVATGGFSTHSASIGYYSQPLLQWACTLFMFISAINFALPIKLLTKGECGFHKDEEFGAFALTAILVSVIFSCQMYRNGLNLTSTTGAAIATSDATLNQVEAYLRTAAFQVASTMSTTGFATSDYLSWKLPGLPAIILFLMLLGGCAGSTAGGLKFARFLVLIKQTKGETRRKIFPHLMPDVHLSGERLEMSVVHQTMAFLVIYLCTVCISTLVLPFLCNMDLDTALSATMSAISNVGPGLGKVSPECNYNWMTPSAKYLLSFIMIAGRLELYTVFVVLMPRFWRTGR